MSAFSEILAPERSPEVEAELVAARKRASITPDARERLIEAAFAAAFIVAATLFAALAPWERSLDALPAVALVLAAAASCRVVFSVGSTYTTPTQLVLVPMLLMLPVAVVPLALAAGFLLSAAIETATTERPLSKLPNALADCWFAIPPALVLLAAGQPGAETVGPAILALALAAQILGDFAVSSLREHLHTGAPLREQIREGAWVYLTDAFLTPLGFVIALGAIQRDWVIVLPFALIGLLAVFAREREERLDSIVELSEAYRGTALVLGDVVEHDDAYTGAHTRGVVGLATRVGEELGLKPRRQRLVEFGALLHDVGKIAVPNEIINKPGPLTSDEWQVIRTHTVVGERMLTRIGGLMSEVGHVVRSAHERWDGAGYPDGLTAEEIPLESRIIFCCDAYDAMTSDRSYRRALDVEVALGELEANAGTQFDPRVVEVLARVVRSDHAASSR
ncbi:HD-GYP domain-containing protein [Thermoleophilia bacterium SCSIO 60948]|nr:HD-GYP domain-containing protein [Thermoleophilia bacterium SCSIO 60948]